MNFYTIDIKTNNSTNVYRIVRENKLLLRPIALHDIILSKYALILGYYTMSQSKFDIFTKLDRKQRLGMLNRHILGVASKIGIHQCFLNQFNGLRKKHEKCKKYISKDKFMTTSMPSNFWQKEYEENQSEMRRQYNMLLDMILEEIDRRKNPKYLRKKKLQEIKNNLQN